jgi:hypothetical protein
MVFTTVSRVVKTMLKKTGTDHKRKSYTQCETDDDDEGHLDKEYVLELAAAKRASLLPEGEDSDGDADLVRAQGSGCVQMDDEPLPTTTPTTEKEKENVQLQVDKLTNELAAAHLHLAVLNNTESPAAACSTAVTGAPFVPWTPEQRQRWQEKRQRYTQWRLQSGFWTDWDEPPAWQRKRQWSDEEWLTWEKQRLDNPDTFLDYWTGLPATQQAPEQKQTPEEAEAAAKTSREKTMFEAKVALVAEKHFQDHMD